MIKPASPRLTPSPPASAHRAWVRLCHWILALSFFASTVSGFVILMCHPRLYWGEVGNDLTPALIELPISRNHRHGGWEKATPFFETPNSPVSASRTFEIFNQNGWGRSLHFLAGWFLVIPGAAYLVLGLATGHFWRHFVPRRDELSASVLVSEIVQHARLRIRPGTGGPQYSVLQKSAYAGIVFVVMPLAVVTGLAMSPAVTAAYPFLSGMFGGHQSARTVHFFASLILVLFLLLHVLMVVRSGFGRQMRGMTLGK